jgi:circadian clock protein KaiC
MSDPESPQRPVRLPTGVRGLDAILGGGLYRGGIYIVTGPPGAGKTTFGNQVSFRHAGDGGRAAYITLLSETHARMLFQIQTMSFYEPAAVGSSLVYLNGFTAIEGEGLEGLLKLVRRVVRDQRAGLLVLDGMVTAGTLAASGIDYKKFINELQTWVGVVGCTVLFLTSASVETMAQPESSMVDGIFELQTRRWGLRAERHLTVTKFRGSGFVEGSHVYTISQDGVVVYPRLEALERPEPARLEGERIATGARGLDRILGGGLSRGSTTLALGAAGAGKTTLALQLLGAGLESGEPAVYLGFAERPEALYARGDQLGLDLRRATARGALTVLWSSPAEPVIDRLADQLLEAVRQNDARRVAIDGLGAFRRGSQPERVVGLVEALLAQLSALGATTLLCDDPTPDGPAVPPGLTHNVFSLHPITTGARTPGLLTVTKTRNSAHERGYHQYVVDGSGLRVLGAADPAAATAAKRPRKPLAKSRPRRR